MSRCDNLIIILKCALRRPSSIHENVTFLSFYFAICFTCACNTTIQLDCDDDNTRDTKLNFVPDFAFKARSLRSSRSMTNFTVQRLHFYREITSFERHSFIFAKSLLTTHFSSSSQYLFLFLALLNLLSGEKKILLHERLDITICVLCAPSARMGVYSRRFS